jgi:hypothetical protein
MLGNESFDTEDIKLSDGSIGSWARGSVTLTN